MFAKGGDHKKVQFEECIEREKHKLSKIENNLEYDDGI